MSNLPNITCPVSAQRVNENVVRVVALQVLLLAVLGIYSFNFYISIFLAADFAIRTFTSGKWSILRFVALQINAGMKIKPTFVDAAPKKFAAGVGILFSVLIATFQYFHYPLLAYSVGGILVICAFLEGVIGYCVGCTVYTLVVKPFAK